MGQKEHLGLYMKKNSIKNNTAFWSQTLIYSVGFIGLRAISFLLLPLYTNLLSARDVGWIFIIYTVLAFLNTIYSHGMDSALLKFFNSSTRLSIIMTTSIIYSILFSLVLGIMLFLSYYFINVSFYHYSSVYNQIVVALLCVATLDMLSSRNITVVRLLEKPYYYLSICFVNVCLSIGLNIYFIQFLNFGLLGAVFALVAVSCVQFILLCPIMVSCFRWDLFNRALLQKMIRFGLPFFPASVFFILIEMSDRWMLGYFKGVEEVGLYGAGYKIGSIVLLLVRGFNLNWQPYYLKKTQADTTKTFAIIGTNFILILLFFSTIITSMWPIAFQYHWGPYNLIGQSFWEGGKIIPIVAVSYILYGLFILQMPSIYLKNKQNWTPLFWGFGFVINVVANLYLIPRLGIYGAAYGTLLAYGGMAGILIYKNIKWMPLNYRLKPITVLLFFSLLCYYGSALLYDTRPFYVYVTVFVYGVCGVSYIKHTFNKYTL